ncbi:MAG TPA: polysaccharide deacetylase family protein [Solirubrobacterales bacterium]|nr:polysaccharide deacetylase family protein [Solirubrobacterales bacterium]
MLRRFRPRLMFGIVAASWALLALPAQAAASPTVVSLTFDDTLSNQYQTGSMLAARNMHASYYVNSSRVGQAGYMTKAQLLDLQSQGSEIAGHTVNHLDLSTVDTDEQKRQICDDRSSLLGWGFAVSDFAYPFGSDGPALEQIVQNCGYNSARDYGGLTESGGAAETVPPADPFAIKTVGGVTASTTLADLEGAVTQAEQAGGGWVTFVFHNVCDGCSTLAVSPSTLASFLDWLAPRGAAGTSVKTVHDVIGGDVNPAVPGPPPPPVRSGNVLLNPSLETDAKGDGFADCWQPNSWRVNTSNWSRTTDAHSGGFAERVDVTSYTSGAVRLLSQQDLGYCAPTALAGHSYKLSAWYKGSARPRLVAFVRNAVGTWRVLGQSARLSKSTTWKRGSWTTPALPSDANGIGIAVALESVGSLTMDDLAISDTASP